MNQTKTERRSLAQGLAKAKKWTELNTAIAVKAFKKTIRSGSHDCKCGQKISRTRTTCLACKGTDVSQQ